MSPEVSGFVYVADEEQGLFLCAQPGCVVARPTRSPPWIVVDHKLESVIVSRWPGKLWKVTVLDAVTDQDVVVAGAGRLVPDAGYTRAVSVQVLEELAPAVLFGPAGVAVCRILESISRLDYEQATALSTRVTLAAAVLYSKAWNCWLRGIAPNSYHLGQEHDHVLAIPTQRGAPQSPINQGFLIIHSQLHKRAILVSGTAALQSRRACAQENNEDDAADYSDDDDDGMWLEPTWSRAADALLYAAMATGAREFLTEEEQRVLGAAWTGVFGGLSTESSEASKDT
jgi:hypothetical protein